MSQRSHVVAWLPTGFLPTMSLVGGSGAGRNGGKLRWSRSSEDRVRDVLHNFTVRLLVKDRVQRGGRRWLGNDDERR
jgi:hypothetical protein